MAKAPTRSSAPHVQLVWYIQAAGRVWGPYPQARLASFVVDKRLTADSLIATHQTGPFGPAGRRGELHRLFEPFAIGVEAVSPPATSTVEPPVAIRNKPVAQAPSKSSPASRSELEPAPALEPSRPPGSERRPKLAAVSSAPRQLTTPPHKPSMREPSAKAARLARAFVVWADLTSVSVPVFEATLAKHGPFVGVRPGVWLLRAGTEAAALRNVLSRVLTGEDALLVIDAPLERAAWFNLDHEAESNLRQLWGGGEG